MKKIKGNNNFGLIGNAEYEIDDKTSVITNAEVAEAFDTKEQLRTFVASMNIGKFPPIPDLGQNCEKGKIYKYGNNKVKCVQSHDRMHYTPEQTPALWLIIPTVEQGYPDWNQPVGGHDAYQKGDKVRFNGKDYESLINANVWSPTAYPAGWKKL